jgi:Tfp pilus assembly protein PilV
MPRRAFTLVEAAISMVIVSVMLAAALATVGAAAGARGSQAEWRMAGTLGESLLSEVMQADFGSESIAAPMAEPTRSEFATVDHYDALVDDPPTNRSGEPIPGAQAWRRSVSVQRVPADNPFNGSLSPGAPSPIKRIRVSVVSPRGTSTQFTGLRSKWGIMDSEASPDSTLVGVETRLTIVGGGTYSSLATTPNQPDRVDPLVVPPPLIDILRGLGGGK